MRWIALLVLACACGCGKHEEPHWSYDGETGPDNWAKLNPEWEIASKGKRQSPIDLGGAKLGKAINLEFHYGKSRLRLVNNGHTIRVNVEKGHWFAVGGKRYNLVQFHFHSPSEHTIKGEYFAMEVHLVHRSADDRLAVIGFLVDEGPASASFHRFFEDVPPVGETREIPDFVADLTRILPKDVEHKFHYSGSLTTPPCTEDVEWYILKTHLTLSASQIAKYRKFYSGNNRPLQPLHGRTVEVD
jgi:carbonic anhydrase